MILTKYCMQICFGVFPTTYKTKTKNRFLIFILKIWLLEYFLSTTCSVYGLFDESSNESLSSQYGPSPQNFEAVSIPIRLWTFTPICMAHLHDNCYNFHYVTRIIHEQPIHMRVFTVVKNFKHDNEDPTFVGYTDGLRNSNSTKLSEAAGKQTSKNVRKSDNMRQYKNILDLIELFLCFVIAICVELIPLVWQQFQRQQQTFLSHPPIQAQQQERARQTQLARVRYNTTERNFLIQLGRWGWLLARRNGCFRTNVRFKETKTDTLLAVKLPMQQKERAKDCSTDAKQQYAIVFSVVVLRSTDRLSRAKPKATDFDTSYVIRPPRTCIDVQCKNTTQNDEVIPAVPQQKTRPAMLASRQKEKLKFYCKDTVQQNECYDSKSGLCSFYYCSIYDCYCCCCCCCCYQCDCCCICYRTRPCCVCGYSCCFCCCSTCTLSTSCAKCSSSNSSCCCFYLPNVKAKAKVFCNKYAPQNPREHSKEPSNSINVLKNLCQHACECVLEYILGLCCKKNPLYHQQQRRLQQQRRSQHTPKKKNDLCNGHHSVDNCTSNYQQLKANNVCKFFCNNRKRQRRRRRKRRRRHTMNSQDGQSSNRLNLAIVSNSQPVRRIQRVQIRCMSSVLGSLFTTFQNALKTIIKFQKLQNNQQIQISKDNLKQTTRNIECDSHLFIKIVKNPISSQHQTLKRICCRGLRSRPNLVWLFIGLVWFESSRLVDCYIHRQKLSENSASPLLLPASTPAAAFPEQLQILAKSKNSVFKRCFPIEQYADSKYETQLKTGVQTTGVFLQKNSNGIVQTTRRYPNPYDIKTTNQRNHLEYSLPNDQVRLESIKSQILSKLGLSGRPNVSHPLPREFIWDTIYRVDEMGTMMKNFDFADMGTQGSASTWSLMDNYGREHTVQVRVQSNSTHAPHQSYKYSEKQQQPFNSVSQQPNFQNTRDNFKNPRNRKNNNYNNKNKLTYLSGITSGMEVPINLDNDPSYIGGSPRHETEAFGLNSNNNGIVSDIYRSQMSAKQQEEGYLNDGDTDEYFGKTEEIISFAEEGQLYSQHRLVEFSTKTKDLIQGKLFVRKAEIHLRIDHKKGKRRKIIESSGKLKIWIFRMVETNVTNSIPDSKIQFCAAFDVDTRFLGWKKLDITETVQHWLMSRRMGRATEKLRLLIDCTGCVDQYRLHLFETKKLKDDKRLGDTQRKNKFQGPTKALRNDVVALWLKQQAERNNSLAEEQREMVEPHLQEQRTQKQNPDENLYRPFLVIRAEIHRSKRVRRRVVDCSGALRGQCCKESFYVSFKALGWDDWIIAPRGYFANYCRGECTGPFRTPDTFQTFHAHFIEEYRKMGLLNGMKPCCAPIKFSSMSLIYYGDDGIIKRDLPKMVVDECGCP